MYYRLSIFQKIWLTVTLLIAGYLSSVLFSYLQGLRNEDRIHLAYETLFPVSLRIGIAENTFTETVHFFQDAVTIGEPELVRQAQARLQTTEGSLTAIADSMSGPLEAQRQDLFRLRERLRDFAARAPAVYLALSSAHLPIESPNDLESEAVDLASRIEEIRTDLSALSHSINDEFKLSMEAINQDARDQRWLNLAVFLVVSGTVLPLIALIITRSIARPLRKSLFLEQALEQSVDGVAVSDPQGVIQFVNLAWARLHGVLPDQMHGLSLTELPKEPAAVEGLIRAAGKGEAHNSECTLRRRDGSDFPARISLAAVKDESGKVLGLVCIATDISASKEAEATLRQAKEAAQAAAQAKSDFLANMSHEIRTPMNSVIGFTNLALRTTLTAEQFDFLDKIRRNADLLMGIINDILDFSKLEAGRLMIEQRDFDLQEVMEDVINMFACLASEKETEMILFIEPGVPRELVGDSLRLRQILTNLTSNAVKFTEGGEVYQHVRCTAQGRDRVTLVFEIKDTGIGIAADKVVTLFTAFTQADASTTRRYGGTGLGLAISKKLVELMGGTIWLTSQEGAGSTFSFSLTFPVTQDTKQQPIPRERCPDLRGLRVLVVDDNQDCAQVISALVTSFGFAVETAPTASDGLARLRTAQVDGRPIQLLLLDWKMATMDGLTLAKLIRDDARLAGLPLIMLSAFRRSEVMVEAARLGIKAFLAKPITPSLLFDTIMGVFGRQEDTLPPADAGADKAPDLRGRRVLLAEDNIYNQEVARRLLQETGLTVDIADNGLLAVEAIRRQTYDAVLMDVQMPEMNGYMASRTIRTVLGLAEIPIIALTAHALAGDRERCLDAGMNDYLAKPIEPDQLFALLRRWLPAGSERSTEDQIACQERPLPMTATTAAREALATLPGVDAPNGLRRMHGDVALYVRLLEHFCRDYCEVTAEFRRLLAADDLEAARHLAYTLKGAAGNLSATRLREVAAHLEEALRKTAEAGARVDTVPDLEARLAQLQAVLTPLSKAVAATLGDQLTPPSSLSRPEAIDSEEAWATLSHFASLLAENRVAAKEALAQVLPILQGKGAVPSTALGTLTVQVREFAFDKALATFRAILEHLDIVLEEEN